MRIACSNCNPEQNVHWKCHIVGIGWMRTSTTHAAVAVAAGDGATRVARRTYHAVFTALEAVVIMRHDAQLTRCAARIHERAKH